MAYKSAAQERFFHSPGAAKAGITPGQVSEFDSASKGMNLPDKVKSKNSPRERRKAAGK